MITVIREGHVAEVKGDGGPELWLHRDEVERASGWQMKPEGFCQGDVCVPLPKDTQDHYLKQDTVNVSALWSLMGKPAVASKDRQTWFLGEGAADRNEGLKGLEAPDFTLPDFSGKLHSLTDFRRMRVLLITWASW